MVIVLPLPQERWFLDFRKAITRYATIEDVVSIIALCLDAAIVGQVVSVDLYDDLSAEFYAVSSKICFERSAGVEVDDYELYLAEHTFGELIESTTELLRHHFVAELVYLPIRPTMVAQIQHLGSDFIIARIKELDYDRDTTV